MHIDALIYGFAHNHMWEVTFRPFPNLIGLNLFRTEGIDE